MRRYPRRIRVKPVNVWTDDAKRRWLSAVGPNVPLPKSIMIRVYSAADEAAMRRLSMYGRSSDVE
jgi:hypothetical protein